MAGSHTLTKIFPERKKIKTPAVKTNCFSRSNPVNFVLNSFWIKVIKKLNLKLKRIEHENRSHS